jgi:hypothetical protein
VREVPLAPGGDGHFEATVSGLGPGALYQFRLDEALLPDPYARELPFGVHGPARVIDPDAYVWRHPPRREPLSGRTVVYELHVGTFTAEGTFAAARARLRVGVEGGLFWVWRWGAEGGHRALVWNVGERAVPLERPPLPATYEWAPWLRSERSGEPGVIGRFEAVVFAAEGPPPA